MTIQRKTVTFNGFNEEVAAWATLASVFVWGQDASAAESYRAAEVGGQISTRFTIRLTSAVSTVNPNDRLIYRGTVFNITGVRETKRGRWLEIDGVAQPDIQAVESSP